MLIHLKAIAVTLMFLMYIRYTQQVDLNIYDIFILYCLTLISIRVTNEDFYVVKMIEVDKDE